MRKGQSTTESDIRYIEAAIQEAHKRAPLVDPQLLELLGSLLIGAQQDECSWRVIHRFQQLSGPAMAKAQRYY